jgi:hypothetical protein
MCFGGGKKNQETPAAPAAPATPVEPVKPVLTETEQERKAAAERRVEAENQRREEATRRAEAKRKDIQEALSEREKRATMRGGFGRSLLMTAPQGAAGYQTRFF